MWVLFDLNGTLVDPSVLLEDGAIGVAALDEANMMAMVTVLAGAEAEFKPLLDAALRRGLERAGQDPALAADALARLPSMPAYPDVPDALAALRSGGFQLAVLTQSAVDAAETVLSNAGIRDHFELVLSAPDSGAFKPEDLAYTLRARTGRRDRRLVRRRPLVGRRRRRLRRPPHGLDLPHRPRLPDRDATPGHPRRGPRRGRRRQRLRGEPWSFQVFNAQPLKSTPSIT